VMAASHEWHMIRTLQFDRKRFLIATIENNIATDHVFYTDHYSRSSYLVQFAASQHRFMLKMRQWQLTLSKESTSMKDVDVDPEERRHPQIHPSPPKPFNAAGEVITDEYIQRCYGSDAQKLCVTLDKHPSHGLGLTLVDGVINNVKGVYIKSVSSEGSGQDRGLKVGDCLLSINGVSLFDKTRHDAVTLVKSCDRDVNLEILRFPSITEQLGVDNG
jgi:tyrosine-protein phosphatase non-receptor type 13 protein